MEGLVNPNDYDINRIMYIIYKDEARCCISGIWFVNGESSHFNIKDKIRKLDEIIDNIINKLNDIPIKEDRENLIKLIKDKKGMLANLLKQYNDIEKDYIEFDKYYRKELFEFYTIEYENTWFFDFAKKRMYLSILNELQIIIKNKFYEYFNNYLSIRESFFKINNYFINLKILYNIQP